MKLNLNEVSFIISAIENIQIAGKDAPFVASVMTKLRTEGEKLAAKEQEAKQTTKGG